MIGIPHSEFQVTDRSTGIACYAARSSAKIEMGFGHGNLDLVPGGLKLGGTRLALQATNRVSPQGDVWNDDSQRFPEKGLGNQSFVSHRKCVTRPACMVPRSLMASGVGRRPCHGYLPHSAGGYGLKGRVTPVLVEIGLSFQFLLRKTGDALARRSNPNLTPTTRSREVQNHTPPGLDGDACLESGHWVRAGWRR